jgi:hypothetical protein
MMRLLNTDCVVPNIDPNSAAKPPHFDAASAVAPERKKSRGSVSFILCRKYCKTQQKCMATELKMMRAGFLRLRLRKK